MEQRNLLSPRPHAARGLTREVIAGLLAAGPDPRGRSDNVCDDIERADPVPAAVLVPLIDHADGLTVLLTQRTAHLANHAGQISFPGGRLEPADRGDSVICALRETQEEVGLPQSTFTVLGMLDNYLTGTGFMVTPVVAVARPPLAIAADPFEVAEVFEVPLAFLMEPAHHERHQREVAGLVRPFWAISWGERLIWGATAGILVNLSQVLGQRGPA
jgi:8-oxo-dGTP pyrophosphatase MutT (NUDIX family)